MLKIREVSIQCHDAGSLIAELDRELGEEYAPEHRHPVDLDPFHRDGGVFVIAYAAEKPVACGALRPIDEFDVEIKRMFVAPANRGRGHSRGILQFLENKARNLGFQRLLLETGDQQIAAIGLYSSSGFRRIAPFGEYAHSPRSVCFAKPLSIETLTHM